MNKILFRLIKILDLIMCFALCFELTGCWDSIETEKLGVVTLLGIESAKNNNIKVTVQEVAPKNQGSDNQSSSSTPNRPFYIYSEEGSTISEAIQKISSSEHQKIYFAHTKVIILDEKMVKSKGIQPIIDFYERTLEMRPRTWLLISKNGKIKKILNTNIGVNMDTGSILEETISNEDDNSYFNVKNMNDFIEMLVKPGSEAYTSGISVLHTKSHNKFIIKDTAVFKNKRMVGWLKNKKSRGLSFASGNVKGGIISIPFKGKILSLKILNTDIKTYPSINKGKMQINLMLKVLSNIAESYSNSDFMNEKTVKKIQLLENETIKNEITSAFNKSKNLNSDIFEFGSYFDMYYPKLWKSIKNNWYSYYPNLQLNIQVDSTVKNIGRFYKTLEK